MANRGSYPDEKKLPALHHETAGVLYNVDIKAGAALPEIKVYIPVRHYGGSDLSIAEGVGVYLDARGRGQYVEPSFKALAAIGAHRDRDDSAGLQTYVSCAVQKGKLASTSYIGPAICQRNRWTCEMEKKLLEGITMGFFERSKQVFQT